MGTYYEVQDVEANGKKLNVYPHNKYPKLDLAGRLVAVCDHAIFKVAMDVTDTSEYDYCYKQYFSGIYLTHDLYDYTPPKKT